VLRWWVGRLVGERYKGHFPLGTFLINISGSLAIGYLSVLFNVDWHNRHGHGMVMNALVITGVLGGYTTFSSMQLDAAGLAAKQHARLAAFYLLLSVASGLLAAGGGRPRPRTGLRLMELRFAVLLVFIGGAVGSIVREFLMLLVPTLSDGFPLDILVANVVASLLIGVSTGRHNRKVINDGWHLTVTTGIMGGLSTFSSFTYASSVLMKASMTSALVAASYVLISLVMGYGAVIVGMKIGGPNR
jgi:fluoride exporter